MAATLFVSMNCDAPKQDKMWVPPYSEEKVVLELHLPITTRKSKDISDIVELAIRLYLYKLFDGNVCTEGGLVYFYRTVDAFSGKQKINKQDIFGKIVAAYKLIGYNRSSNMVFIEPVPNLISTLEGIIYNGRTINIEDAIERLSLYRDLRGKDCDEHFLCDSG